MSIPPDITVVADLDPQSAKAVIMAAEMRFELTERIGPVSISFVTLQEVPLASRRQGAWRPASEVNLAAASVVIAPNNLKGDALRGVDPKRLRRTTLLDEGVGGVLRRHVDASAVEIRRRMLEHLGIFPLEPSDLAAHNFAAGDLLAIVETWRSSGIPIDDPALRTLLAPHVSPATDAELVRVAAELTSLLPEVAEDEMLRLRSRIAYLSESLAASRLDQHRLEAACSRFQQQVDVLTDRLDAQRVRVKLQCEPDGPDA